MNANFSKPEWMMPANAIDEPRLARGLVREELRQVHDAYKNPAYRPIRNFMNALVDKYMPPSGKFSTPMAAKLMKRLVKEAERYIHPFRTFDTAILVHDEDSKVSPVHGMFYWLKTKANFDVDNEDKSFVGNFVELRCMRVSGTRRRLMYDDAFCHFSVGEHCLARMLERGAAPRDALRDLSSQFDTVVPTAIMFAAAYKSGHHNEYPNLIIPYRDGILLCKAVLMDLTKNDAARWHRFRITADKLATRPDEFSMDPVLLHTSKDRSGAVSIYAATYVPRLQMSTEQIWAKMQIEKLVAEEEPFLQGYLKMTYLVEDLDSDVAQRLPDLLRRMEKLMNSPRWKIATSTNLMVGS